jgi:hypothetical protein
MITNRHASPLPVTGSLGLIRDASLKGVVVWRHKRFTRVVDQSRLMLRSGEGVSYGAV